MRHSCLIPVPAMALTEFRWLQVGRNPRREQSDPLALLRDVMLPARSRRAKLAQYESAHASLGGAATSTATSPRACATALRRSGLTNVLGHSSTRSRMFPGDGRRARQVEPEVVRAIEYENDAQRQAATQLPVDALVLIRVELPESRSPPCSPWLACRLVTVSTASVTVGTRADSVARYGSAAAEAGRRASVDRGRRRAGRAAHATRRPR